jgi:hypothetical protein
MNPHHVRLKNAARRALFQRARVIRSATGIQQQVTPAALKKRAKSKVEKQLTSAANASEKLLRRHRLPLSIAAIAGLAFAFRTPLISAADWLADQLRSDSHPPSPATDDDHEAN